MSVVTATRYNAIQTKIANVLGTGSGDKGYGQTVTSSQETTGTVINATHLNKLHADINRAIFQQTNSNTSAINTLAAGDIIEETNSTTKKGWAQYEAEATVAESNRLTANASNMTTTSKLSIARTTAWGGSPDSINATWTVGFASADAKRNYFNAGGEVRIASALSGGSGSKGTSWTNLLSGVGTVKFGRTATTSTGSGDETSVGNVDMSGSHQQIFQHDVGSGVYGENDFNITARDNNTTTLEFIITFNDDDSGDQTGTGAAVDENVGGTLTVTVSSFRATNAAGAVIADPTFTTTNGLN